MNPKELGERGESIVIGELAKWCIDVAIPISDNNPFDLILMIGKKIFKAQIKTTSAKTSSNSVSFGLDTNNWYTGDFFGYTREDCDVILCCDLISYCVYLLSPSDFEGKRSFTIRTIPSKNKQIKRCNLHDDFIISKERIKSVLKVDVKKLSEHFNDKTKKYQLVCTHCKKIFSFNCKWRKFCSTECRNAHLSRNSKKPPRIELAELLKVKTPWTRIGEKYGVSDNAARKWARRYGLI